MGERAGGDLHHVLESPYMASKVHGCVPGHYVPEEMVFLPMWELELYLRVLPLFEAASMGVSEVNSRRSD